jgi:hypothetical protein
MEFIRDRIGAGPVVLLADQYPVHVFAMSLLKPRELGIQLMFVPKGATSICQPLGRRISGTIKSNREKLDRRTFSEEDLVLNRQSAASFAKDCWNEIPSESIRESWDMEGIRTELGRTGSIAANDADEGHETDIINIDGEDSERSPCDIEFGYDDIEVSDMTMMEETAERME